MCNEKQITENKLELKMFPCSLSIFKNIYILAKILVFQSVLTVK